MFLVMMAIKWEDLELIPNFSGFPKTQIKADDGMIGIVPVFENREDALKFAGEGKEFLVAEVKCKEVKDE